MKLRNHSKIDFFRVFIGQNIDYIEFMSKKLEARVSSGIFAQGRIRIRLFFQRVDPFFSLKIGSWRFLPPGTAIENNCRQYCGVFVKERVDEWMNELVRNMKTKEEDKEVGVVESINVAVSSPRKQALEKKPSTGAVMDSFKHIST